MCSQENRVISGHKEQYIVDSYVVDLHQCGHADLWPFDENLLAVV